MCGIFEFAYVEKKILTEEGVVDCVWFPCFLGSPIESALQGTLADFRHDRSHDGDGHHPWTHRHFPSRPSFTRGHDRGFTGRDVALDRSIDVQQTRGSLNWN